jgi:succinate dehydrogenase / fumarate reductase cytochrome b subunit
VVKLFGYEMTWSELAWLGHRASGLGVLLYLFMHIVETSTVLFGPDVYNAAVGIFKNLPARAGEVVLMAAVVYHALNGLRVIAMDFWPRLTVYYRPLTYGVIAATVIAMIPLGVIMLRPFMPWGA